MHFCVDVRANTIQIVVARSRWAGGSVCALSVVAGGFPIHNMSKQIRLLIQADDDVMRERDESVQSGLRLSGWVVGWVAFVCHPVSCCG